MQAPALSAQGETEWNVTSNQRLAKLKELVEMYEKGLLSDLGLKFEIDRLLADAEIG